MKPSPWLKNRGMTLPEILMATTISTMVVAMAATTLLAGLKLTQKINNINGYDASLRIAYFKVSREIELAIRPPVLSLGDATKGYSKLTYTVALPNRTQETRYFAVENGLLVWQSSPQATTQLIARDILAKAPFKLHPDDHTRIYAEFQLGRDAQSYSGQARTLGVLTYKSYWLDFDPNPSSDTIPPVAEIEWKGKNKPKVKGRDS